MFRLESHGLNICVAQKHIQLYDDSVIKLSIKQGVESDRFQPEVDGVLSTDYSVTSTLPGAFTMGELAYTRDTNRVFVGNFTTEKEFLYGSDVASENNGQIIQQTPGGTLVGNKYLGYVDSKPPYNNDNKISAPLSLDKESTFVINGVERVENGVLTEDSKFRSYEFTLPNNDVVVIPTEDHKWNRQSYYNEKYDAYDGDYMYDVYRNALILFDHNIRPSAEWEEASDTKNPRRPSPITPIETDNTEESTKTVYNHTVDMYGDGYVCLYNIIPDGDTLTFNAKDFSNTTGIANDGNYTQNIISVQKVYAGAMLGALDPNTFQTNINKEDKNEKIKLQTTQTFEKINLPESLNEDDTRYLILPNNLGLNNNVCINFNKFNASVSDNKSYRLKFTYNNTELKNYQNYKQLTAEFVDDVVAPRYTLNLGTGLESGDGSNKIFFDDNNINATILLSGALSSGEGVLTDNPFHLTYTESDSLFTSNLITNASGAIRNENKYPDNYAEAAKNIIDHFDNENTKLNYLVQSTPVLKGISGEAIADKDIKFRVTPVIYNVRKDSDGISSVGIHEDTITIGDETLGIDSIKDVWAYCKDGESSMSKYYIDAPAGKCLRISHPINGYTSYYKIDNVDGYSSYVLNNGKSLHFYEEDNSLCASVITPASVEGGDASIDTIKNIKRIYSPTDGSTYNNLTELDTISFNKVNDNIVEYKTNNLNINEYYRFEIETDSDKILISIPTKKYVTEINRISIDNIPEYKCIDLPADSQIIKSITFYNLKTERINGELNGYEVITEHTIEKYTADGENNLAELFSEDKSYLIDEAMIFEDKTADKCSCVYMIVIENKDGYQLTYNFISNNYTIADFNKNTTKLYEKNNWESTAENGEYVDYYFANSENPVKADQLELSVKFVDTKYGIGKEYNMKEFFDFDSLYYKTDNEGNTVCLSGKSENPTDSNYDASYNEDKWLEERRIDIMKQFPIIPAHATSVLLECKTSENSSLILKHVGNNKKSIYSTDYNSVGEKAIINGLTLPLALSDTASWNKDKELLNIDGNTISYIELPISIDDMGNKHFSFKLDYIGNILISLAAYRV